MSNRYAVIDINNTVVNVVLWDGVTEYNPGEGLSLVQINDGTQYNTGWIWDGSAFVDPNPPTETPA